VESEEADLAGGGCPVDKDERKGRAAVVVFEFIREHHIAGRVLGEL
jgi:hypothetical protein